MKIIYDVHGGDKAPVEIIKGAILAKNELSIEPILCGRRDEITSVLNDLGENPSSIDILEAASKIENDEEPVMAIRKKKDSSIVVAASALAQGYGDSLISAGSTGALLAAGIFIVKRIEGIERSPIATLIPTMTKSFLLLDSGSNLEVSPKVLSQYGLMGSVYAKEVLGIANPEVSLMNIGAEEGKGTETLKETYKLLKENKTINFTGNIEPRELPYGVTDVVVADGLVGNIFIKTYEGTASMIKDLIKSQLAEENDPEILLKVKQLLGASFNKFNIDNLGGAPLLGLAKPIIKAHGISDANSILGASKQAQLFVERDVINIIKNNF